MINIRTYKEYWEGMVSRIDDLKGSVLVATEHHFKNKVSNLKDYPVLVAVIPSSDPSSKDVDNIQEKNTGLIFILKKISASNVNDENYIDDMELLQNVIKEVKELMVSDYTDCSSEYHQEMERLDVNSFHQDPEHNYLGHDGWSLSFNFNSLGY